MPIDFNKKKLSIQGNANLVRGCFGYCTIHFDDNDLLRIAREIAKDPSRYGYSMTPEDLLLLLYKLPIVKYGDNVHHFKMGNVTVTVEFDDGKEFSAGIAQLVEQRSSRAIACGFDSYFPLQGDINEKNI